MKYYKHWSNDENCLSEEKYCKMGKKEVVGNSTKNLLDVFQHTNWNHF